MSQPKPCGGALTPAEHQKPLPFKTNGNIAFIVAEPSSIEPFGIMYLVPHLEAAGFTCNIFDADHAALVGQLKAFNPFIIAYSVTTGAHQFYAELNGTLKQKLSFTAVFGGPHPTFFPEFIFENGVDAVALGECDLTFRQFCVQLAATGAVQPTPNFHIKTPKGVITSPIAPLIQDLDSLPFPSRDIYYNLSPKIKNYSVRSFLAARGCPFSCHYCFNHSMDKLYDGTYHRTRTRSPRNLVAEIEQVVSRYPTEFLAFRESIFPLKKKWLVQFAQLMKEKVNLPFYCHLRLDLLDAEKVVLLKEAGCHSVNVGIEAGRADIRNRLLGRPMSDETIVNSCQLLRKAGIKILANNMLGLPSTGFSHDWDTLKLNQRAKPHYSLAMLWQPYPGTRLAKFAEDNNWFNGNLDDLEFSYYNNSHIRFETPEDKSRIENLQRLFAVAAKYPLLSPLFKQITRLPKNKVFDTIFKTVYLVYHQSEIFPHKISPKSWVTHLRGLLE